MKQRRTMLWLALMGTALPVFGQVERSGGGANAQIMQQYQQLAADRTRLRSENENLTAKLDDANKQIKALTAQLTALKANRNSLSQSAVAASQQARVNAEQALKTSRDKMQELVVRYRELAASLREAESRRAQSDQQSAAMSAKYDRCAVSNEELGKISDDVLNRYEHQSAFGNLSRAEPFAHLTQTRIENLVDEYRERAEQLRVERQSRESQPAAGRTPGAQPASGEHMP